MRIICVSEPPLRNIFGEKWPSLSSKNRRELERLGVIVFDRIPHKFHDSVFESAKWYLPIPEHIVLAFVGGQGCLK